MLLRTANWSFHLGMLNIVTGFLGCQNLFRIDRFKQRLIGVAYHSGTEGCHLEISLRNASYLQLGISKDYQYRSNFPRTRNKYSK